MSNLDLALKLKCIHRNWCTQKVNLEFNELNGGATEDELRCIRLIDDESMHSEELDRLLIFLRIAARARGNVESRGMKCKRRKKDFSPEDRLISNCPQPRREPDF